MFAEVKELLTFVSGDDYDAQIIAEIKACALDLTTSAEIVLPGVIDITRTKVLGNWVITDNSTVTDELIIKTIAVWCNKEIGNPPNYDNLETAYNNTGGDDRVNNFFLNLQQQITVGLSQSVFDIVILQRIAVDGNGTVIAAVGADGDAS